MAIRKATLKDLEQILPLYAHAREQMRKNGNPNQWGNNRPSPETLTNDIKNRNLYIIEENSQINGVFAFIPGDDPTYQHIEGNWLNPHPYSTIHRIASASTGNHIFRQCLSFCETLTNNIKIDTHQDNTIMRHLLTQNGFQKCGIIHTDDGTPRIAYQKSL